MKLYMIRDCPYAHRAVIALREKALDFQVVFYDAAKRPAELDAIGPRAKSPTLFDGGGAVHDSLAVLEYIEDRYPEPSLLPRGALDRARVRMLQARASDELVAKQAALARAVIYDPNPDPRHVDELGRAFVAAMGPWDRYLSGKTFACGDAFTLADITLYTIFPSAKTIADVEIPSEYPSLRAWHDRVAARSTAAVPQPA